MPVLGSWVGDAEIGAGAVVLSGNGKVGVRAGEELHRGGNLHADGLAVVGDVRVAGEVDDPAVDVGVGVDVEGFFNGFGELFYGGAGGTDPAGEVVGKPSLEGLLLESPVCFKSVPGEGTVDGDGDGDDEKRVSANVRTPAISSISSCPTDD